VRKARIFEIVKKSDGGRREGTALDRMWRDYKRLKRKKAGTESVKKTDRHI
jgi:hypothetical protein